VLPSGTRSIDPNRFLWVGIALRLAPRPAFLAAREELEVVEDVLLHLIHVVVELRVLVALLQVLDDAQDHLERELVLELLDPSLGLARQIAAPLQTLM